MNSFNSLIWRRQKANEIIIETIKKRRPSFQKLYLKYIKNLRANLNYSNIFQKLYTMKTHTFKSTYNFSRCILTYNGVRSFSIFWCSPQLFWYIFGGVRHIGQKLSVQWFHMLWKWRSHSHAKFMLAYTLNIC